jgi:hypothetical protein
VDAEPWHEGRFSPRHGLDDSWAWPGFRPGCLRIPGRCRARWVPEAATKKNHLTKTNNRFTIGAIET